MILSPPSQKGVAKTHWKPATHSAIEVLDELLAVGELWPRLFIFVVSELKTRDADSWKRSNFP
jgi:hypothetical protein